MENVYMGMDSLFLVALQSSFALGIIHGINPCGHSWLVLAPFVVGEKNGRKVSFLTISFLLGTTLACMILGLTLGAVSLMLPESLQFWVDAVTAAVLIGLGILLIIKPSAIHHHDHSHDHHHHDEGHQHDHHHAHDGECTSAHMGKPQKLTGLAMFSIGFFNMIVPCPTAAIMYGYALDSQHTLKAFSVFTLYALATSIAVGAVILLIFKITNLVSTLTKEWVETALMRFAGALTLCFGLYSLVSHNLLPLG